MIKKFFALSFVPIFYAISLAQAQEQPEEIEFNSLFLRSDIDISQFSKGNPFPAGIHSVDLYVNNNWKGRHNITFKQLTPDALVAQPCFNLQTVQLFDINLDKLNTQTLTALAQGEQCPQLASLIEGSSTEMDTATQRLYVTIPQIFLHRQSRGYVNPDLWDNGIPALTLQYNYNAYQSRIDGLNTQNSQYLGFNSGANLGAWRLRQRGAFQWNNQGNHMRYQNSTIYLERGLSRWKSRLTLGESNTNGQVFDSLSFRGIQLASDDRMYSDSERGFSPVIQGLANSNALVTVRQNGSVIYETTVPPGAFVIDDLHSIGRGGDLQVTIKEADGSERSFSVPYSYIPELLRPGTTRYSIMGGQFQNSQIDDDPAIMMGTLRHGFSNLITGYTGAIGAEGYTAALLGTAFNTELGAISIDTTHARTELPDQTRQSGNNIRLSYAKVLPKTNTNLNISASRTTGKGYYDARDALLLRDSLKRGITSPDSGWSQKSRAAVSVSQSLPQGYGALAANLSYQNYWEQKKSHVEYQLSYSNNYKRISYTIAAQRARNLNNHDWENQIMFSLSLPLGGSQYSPNWRFGVTKQADNTTYNNSLSGKFGNNAQFNYSVFTNTIRPQDAGSTTSFGGSANWATPYADVGVNASKGRNYSQYGLNASGAVVAYSEGVVFAPFVGETVAIVEVPHAHGAQINGYNNLKLNREGKNVVPYLTPYRENTVEINPQGLSTDVDLQVSSQNIVPTAGAVTLMQFATQTGYSILLQGRQTNGESLPFGASISDSNGKNVGYIAQGSQAIIRVNEPQGELRVHWGSAEKDQCAFEYEIDPEQQLAPGDFRRLDITCHQYHSGGEASSAMR